MHACVCVFIRIICVDMNKCRIVLFSLFIKLEMNENDAKTEQYNDLTE